MINPNKPTRKIRLLDQGTYGCVFYPGVSCSGKIEKTQYITKVQKKENTSENELKIGKIIQKIKLFEMYFAPIISSCPIQLAKIEQEEIEKCELFKDDAKFISNKIRYVGENTLQKHLMSRLHSDIYTFLPHFLETHIYLIHCLEKLANINVVHYDIKENNIIFDAVNHVPIIIDFGISFDVKLVEKKDFEKVFYSYYDKYSPWCLEITMISFIVKENDWDIRPISVEKLNTMIDLFFANNYVMIIIAKERDIKPYIKQWKATVRKFIHKKGMVFVKELLKKWDTWDHYSISVTYLFMLYDFHWFSKDFLFQYQTLLMDHILSIPEKRMSSAKLLEKIQEIGENIDTSKYNQWIKETIESNEITKQKSRFIETKEIEKQIEKIIYSGYPKS